MTPTRRWPQLRLNSLYAGWAVGTLGASVLLNTFNVATLFFLVTVLKIEPVIAGAMITGSKLYDAATDPLMGFISDRTRSRWGRRRPYLLLGGIISGLSFAWLFAQPPSDGSTAHYAMVVLALLLVSTGYTIFNVPYLAMPAEMISDYHQRAVLMSYRVFLIAVGTFVGIAGTPALVDWFQQGLGQTPLEAYRHMGMVIGAIIGIGMAATFFGTRRGRATERTVTTLPFMTRLKLLWSNRPFVIYLGVKLTGLFALAATISTQFFLVVYVLERSVGIVALFGLGQIVTQVLFLPVWLELSRRHGKTWVLIAATIIFIPLSLSWLLTGPSEPLWAYVLRGAVTGIGAAGTLLGTQAILPDIMEYDYRRTGIRREGAYAGVASFIEKSSSALAAIVIGGFLSAMAFDKSLPAGEQPESAVFAILACTALIPLAMYTLKLVLLWFYDLDESKLLGTTSATGTREAAAGAPSQ